MNFTKQYLVFLGLLALIQSLNAFNSQTICKGRYDGTLFYDPSSCERFYACENNQAVEYNCDSNYHFNKKTLSCMSGSECRDNEMEIDPKCTDGVVAALEGDCLSFNVCVSGQYQKINCPNGYYYNVPNAKCQPINYDADYKCNCVVPDHTLMANPNNCETFYLCEGKKAVLENCSRGQYYNSTQNACLRDNEGICLMEATRSPEMEIEPELEDIRIKTICEQLSNEESVYYPYDNDCSKFLMCTNGRLTLQQCPQKFYYDSNKNYCVLDDEHKCQNSDVKYEEEQSPNKENEAPVIADSKRSKYIAIHNKLFARFMKY